MLRFHVDYFKPEGNNPPKPGEALAKRAIIEAIDTMVGIPVTAVNIHVEDVVYANEQ